MMRRSSIAHNKNRYWLQLAVLAMIVLASAGNVWAEIEYSHHDFNHIYKNENFASLPCIGCHDIHDVVLTEHQDYGSDPGDSSPYIVDTQFESSYVWKVFWPDHSMGVEWNATRTCFNCHDGENLDGSANKYNIMKKMGREFTVERPWGEKQSHHPIDVDTIATSNTDHTCTGCHAQHGVWDAAYNLNYRDRHIGDADGSPTKVIATDINVDPVDQKRWVPKAKLLRAKVGLAGAGGTVDEDAIRRTQSETFCFTCHDSYSVFSVEDGYRGYFNSTIVYRFRPHTDTYTHNAPDINNVSGQRDPTGGDQYGPQYSGDRVASVKRRSSKFFAETKHFKLSRWDGTEPSHPYGNTLDTPLHDGIDPGGDDGDISCLVCHDIHGSNYDNLIKGDLYENDVCRMCHDSEAHDGVVPDGEYAGDSVKSIFGYKMRDALDAEGVATNDPDHIKTKNNKVHPADKKEYYKRGHGSNRIREHLKVQNLKEADAQFQNLKCSACHEPHGSGQYKLIKLWVRDAHLYKSSDGRVVDNAHTHGYIAEGALDMPPVYMSKIEMEDALGHSQGYDSVKLTMGGTDVDQLCFACHTNPAFSRDIADIPYFDWEWSSAVSNNGLGLYYMGKDEFIQTMHYGDKAYNPTILEETGESKRSCRACHDPHGTEENANTLGFEEELCFQCHRAGVSKHGMDLPGKFSFKNEAGYKPYGPYEDADNTKIKSMHEVYDSMQYGHKQQVRYQLSGTPEELAATRAVKVECIYCHNTHLATAERPVMDPANPGSTLNFDTTSLYSSNAFCIRCHRVGAGPVYSRLGQDYVYDAAGERVIDDRELVDGISNPNFGGYLVEDNPRVVLPGGSGVNIAFNTMDREFTLTLNAELALEVDTTRLFRGAWPAALSFVPLSEGYAGFQVDDYNADYNRVDDFLFGHFMLQTTELTGAAGTAGARVICMDCHDPHGSKNKRLLRDTKNRRSVGVPDNYYGATKDDGEYGFDPSGKDALVSRDFCLSCHDGRTELYGITVTPVPRNSDPDGKGGWLGSKATNRDVAVAEHLTELGLDPASNSFQAKVARMRKRRELGIAGYLYQHDSTSVLQEVFGDELGEALGTQRCVVCHQPHQPLPYMLVEKGDTSPTANQGHYGPSCMNRPTDQYYNPGYSCHSTFNDVANFPYTDGNPYSSTYMEMVDPTSKHKFLSQHSVRYDGSWSSTDNECLKCHSSNHAQHGYDYRLPFIGGSALNARGINNNIVLSSLGDYLTSSTVCLACHQGGYDIVDGDTGERLGPPSLSATSATNLGGTAEPLNFPSYNANWPANPFGLDPSLAFPTVTVGGESAMTSPFETTIARINIDHSWSMTSMRDEDDSPIYGSNHSHGGMSYATAAIDPTDFREDKANTADAVICFDCHEQHGSKLLKLIRVYEGLGESGKEFSVTGAQLSDNDAGLGYEIVTREDYVLGSNDILEGAINASTCYVCHWDTSHVVEDGATSRSRLKLWPGKEFYDTTVHGRGVMDFGNAYEMDGKGGAWDQNPTHVKGACVNCHNPHGVAWKGEDGISDSKGRLDVDTNPPTDVYDNYADSTYPFMLYGYEEELCFNCHNGNGTLADRNGAEDIKGYFDGTGNHHPIYSWDQEHDLPQSPVYKDYFAQVLRDEYYDAGYTGPVTNNAKVECAACHNPHTMVDDFTAAGKRLGRNYFDLDSNYPTRGSLGDDDGDVFCIQCHAEDRDKNGLPDLPAEVKAYGVRFHIEDEEPSSVKGRPDMTGNGHNDRIWDKSTYLRTAQHSPQFRRESVIDPDTGLKYPALGTGKLYCVDCHNPHGSNNYRMLRDTLYAAADGRDVWWNDGSNTSLTRVGPFTIPGDVQPYDVAPIENICFVCHDASVQEGQPNAGTTNSVVTPMDIKAKFFVINEISGDGATVTYKDGIDGRPLEVTTSHHMVFDHEQRNDNVRIECHNCHDHHLASYTNDDWNTAITVNGDGKAPFRLVGASRADWLLVDSEFKPAIYNLADSDYFRIEHLRYACTDPEYPHGPMRADIYYCIKCHDNDPPVHVEITSRNNIQLSYLDKDDDESQWVDMDLDGEGDLNGTPFLSVANTTGKVYDYQGNVKYDGGVKGLIFDNQGAIISDAEGRNKWGWATLGAGKNRFLSGHVLQERGTEVTCIECHDQHGSSYGRMIRDDTQDQGDDDYLNPTGFRDIREVNISNILGTVDDNGNGLSDEVNYGENRPMTTTAERCLGCHSGKTMFWDPYDYEADNDTGKILIPVVPPRNLSDEDYDKYGLSGASGMERHPKLYTGEELELIPLFDDDDLFARILTNKWNDGTDTETWGDPSGQTRKGQTETAFSSAYVIDPESVEYSCYDCHDTHNPYILGVNGVYPACFQCHNYNTAIPDVQSEFEGTMQLTIRSRHPVRYQPFDFADSFDASGEFDIELNECLKCHYQVTFDDDWNRVSLVEALGEGNVAENIEDVEKTHMSGRIQLTNPLLNGTGKPPVLWNPQNLDFIESMPAVNNFCMHCHKVRKFEAIFPESPVFVSDDSTYLSFTGMWSTSGGGNSDIGTSEGPTVAPPQLPDGTEWFDFRETIFVPDGSAGRGATVARGFVEVENPDYGKDKRTEIGDAAAIADRLISAHFDSTYNYRRNVRRYDIGDLDADPDKINLDIPDTALPNTGSGLACTDCHEQHGSPAYGLRQQFTEMNIEESNTFYYYNLMRNTGGKNYALKDDFSAEERHRVPEKNLEVLQDDEFCMYCHLYAWNSDPGPGAIAAGGRDDGRAGAYGGRYYGAEVDGAEWTIANRFTETPIGQHHAVSEAQDWPGLDKISGGSFQTDPEIYSDMSTRSADDDIRIDCTDCHNPHIVRRLAPVTADLVKDTAKHRALYMGDRMIAQTFCLNCHGNNIQHPEDGSVVNVFEYNPDYSSQVASGMKPSYELPMPAGTRKEREQMVALIKFGMFRLGEWPGLEWFPDKDESDNDIIRWNKWNKANFELAGHNAPWKLIESGANQGQPDENRRVVCTDCHDPHGSNNYRQLRNKFPNILDRDIDPTDIDSIEAHIDDTPAVNNISMGRRNIPAVGTRDWARVRYELTILEEGQTEETDPSKGIIWFCTKCHYKQVAEIKKFPGKNEFLERDFGYHENTSNIGSRGLDGVDYDPDQGKAKNCTYCHNPHGTVLYDSATVPNTDAAEYGAVKALLKNLRPINVYRMRERADAAFTGKITGFAYFQGTMSSRYDGVLDAEGNYADYDQMEENPYYGSEMLYFNEGTGDHAGKRGAPRYVFCASAYCHPNHLNKPQFGLYTASGWANKARGRANANVSGSPISVSNFEIWQITPRDPFVFDPVGGNLELNWGGFWDIDKSVWYNWGTPQKDSHHPIPEGKIRCEDCHDPHGSDKEQTRFTNPNDIKDPKVNTTHPLALRNNYRFMDAAGYATNDPALRAAYFRNEYWPFMWMQGPFVNQSGTKHTASNNDPLYGAAQLGQNVYTCGNYRAYFCSDNRGETWQGSGTYNFRYTIEGGDDGEWHYEQYGETNNAGKVGSSNAWRAIDPPENANDFCFLCHKSEHIRGQKSTNNSKNNGMANSNTRFRGHEAVEGGAEISVNIAPYNSAVTNDYDVYGNIVNDKQNYSPYGGRYNGEFHSFSCSRCHRPHSVPNEKLLFTRCLSAKYGGYGAQKVGRKYYWHDYQGNYNQASDGGSGVRQCHPYADQQVVSSWGWSLSFYNSRIRRYFPFKGWRSRIMQYEIAGSYNYSKWEPMEFQFRDNLVYVADRAQGMVIVDVSDVTTPVTVAAVVTSAESPTEIILGVDNVYLAENVDGMAIINRVNIADPFIPVVETSVTYNQGDGVVDMAYLEPHVLTAYDNLAGKLFFYDKNDLSEFAASENIIPGTTVTMLAGMEIRKVYAADGYISIFISGTTGAATGSVYVYKNTSPISLFTATAITFASVSGDNISDLYHRVNANGLLEVYVGSKNTAVSALWARLTAEGVPVGVWSVVSGYDVRSIFAKEYDGKHYVYVGSYGAASSLDFRVYLVSEASSILRKAIAVPHSVDIYVEGRYAYIISADVDAAEMTHGDLVIVNIKEDFKRPNKINDLTVLGQDLTTGLDVLSGLDSTTIKFIKKVEGDGIEHAQTDLLLRWKTSEDVNHSHYEIYMIEGQDLIYNGDEFVTTGRGSAVVKSWQSKNLTLARSSATAANGSQYSLAVSAITAGAMSDAYLVQNDENNIYSKFPVEQDGSYQISFFAKTKTTGATRNIKVMVDDDDDHTSSPFVVQRVIAGSKLPDSDTVEIDDKWRQYSFAMTNGGEEKLACNLALLCGDSTIEFYVDSIKMLKSFDDIDNFKQDIATKADVVPDLVGAEPVDQNYGEYTDPIDGQKYSYYWNPYGKIYDSAYYIYAVRDVDDTGNLSFLSNTVTSRLVAADNTSPAVLMDSTFSASARTGARLVQENGGFNLLMNWYDPNENGNVVSYEIFSIQITEDTLDADIVWGAAVETQDDYDSETVFADGHTSVLFDQTNPNSEYTYMDSSNLLHWSIQSPIERVYTTKYRENIYIRTFASWHAEEWWAFKIRAYDEAGLFTDSEVFRRQIIDMPPMNITDLGIVDMHPETNIEINAVMTEYPYNQSGTANMQTSWTIPKDNGNYNGNWYRPGEEPADVVADPSLNGSLMAYNVYRVSKAGIGDGYVPDLAEYELVYTINHGGKVGYSFTFYADRAYDSVALGNPDDPGIVNFVDTTAKDAERLLSYAGIFVNYQIRSIDNAGGSGEVGTNPQLSEYAEKEVTIMLPRTIAKPSDPVLLGRAASSSIAPDGWLTSGSTARLSYSQIAGGMYPGDGSGGFVRAYTPRWRRSPDDSPFLIDSVPAINDARGFEDSIPAERVGYYGYSYVDLSLQNKRPGRYGYAMFVRYGTEANNPSISGNYSYPNDGNLVVTECWDPETETLIDCPRDGSDLLVVGCWNDDIGWIDGCVPEYTSHGDPIVYSIDVRKAGAGTDGTKNLYVGLFDLQDGQYHLERQYVIHNYDGSDRVDMTYIRLGTVIVRAYIDDAGDGDKYPAWEDGMRDAADAYSNYVSGSFGGQGGNYVITIEATDW